MNSIFNNIACAACGCICEGITVRVSGGKIAEIENACRLCAEQLLGQSSGESVTPPIDAAVEILAKSRSPLIYGLADSTVAGQRAAIAFAEALGATIDLALPAFHRSAVQAMQSVGVSTCTLGEARQRADVVVFWGADPTTTHPQLMDRLVNPPGQFVRGTRHVVNVGSQRSEHHVNETINLNPADNLAALSVLRAQVTGVATASTCPQFPQLSALADRLQQAAYSVFFYGPAINRIAEIESLFRLIRQLNTRSRSAAIGLGGTQCENALTWQTGYPFCVNFALGYPRYDPVRFSANLLLERGEVDTVVLIGSQGIDLLSAAAQAQLAKLPVVDVGFPEYQLPFKPAVHFVTARPGVHCGGTLFRMDGVPVKLRPVFDSPLHTTEAVLTAIQQGVSASCV